MNVLICLGVGNKNRISLLQTHRLMAENLKTVQSSVMMCRCRGINAVAESDTSTVVRRYIRVCLPVRRSELQHYMSYSIVKGLRSLAWITDRYVRPTNTRVALFKLLVSLAPLRHNCKLAKVRQYGTNAFDHKRGKSYYLITALQLIVRSRSHFPADAELSIRFRHIHVHVQSVLQ